MTGMQTSLPSFEATQQSSFVKLERVILSNNKWMSAPLNMERVSDGKRYPVTAPVYEIDEDRVRGLPPMRTWYGRHDDEVHMLFLVTPMLPNAQRPFGNGKTYIATVFVGPEDTIEYEVGLPIGIDLIHTAEGTYYAFIFGEKDYNNVVLPANDEERVARADRLEELDISNELIDLYKD